MKNENETNYGRRTFLKRTTQVTAAALGAFTGVSAHASGGSIASGSCIPFKTYLGSSLNALGHMVHQWACGYNTNNCSKHMSFSCHNTYSDGTHHLAGTLICYKGGYISPGVICKHVNFSQ